MKRELYMHLYVWWNLSMELVFQPGFKNRVFKQTRLGFCQVRKSSVLDG